MEAIRNNLKVIILFYALILGWWPVRNMSIDTWFALHPTSMTFSYAGLTYVGILYKQLGGYKNTIMHGYMMTAGCLLAAFGIYVIYTNKIILNKVHFTTTHGFYGIVAFIGYISIEIVGGLLLHPNFGLMKTNKLIKTAHRYFGHLIQSLCWYSIVNGFAKLETNNNTRAIFLAPLFLLVITSYKKVLYPTQKAIKK